MGDASWLGPDGTVGAGDRVLILFWTPNTVDDRTSASLLQWSYIEVVLSGAKKYVIKTQTKEAFTPNCDFSINAETRVLNDVIVTDVNSNDIHTWSFSGRDHYHGRQPWEKIFSQG